MGIYSCPTCSTEVIRGGNQVATLDCPGCGQRFAGGSWVPKARVEGVRRQRGCFVPEFVVEHPDVTAVDIVVFCSLDIMCSRGGEGTPSMARLAAAVGVSESSVRRSIKRLIRIGAMLKRFRYEYTASGEVRQRTNFYKLAGLEPFELEPSESHLRAVD